MQSSHALALLALRLSALPALAASAAMTVEYRSRDWSFCSPGSGCSVLRQTDLAYLWGAGLSLPELGLLAFALIFVTSLTRWAGVAAWLSVLGGVSGALLLAYQALEVGRFCWLCVVVDLSAVAAAIAGIGWISAERRAPRGANTLEATARTALRARAWVLLGGLAIAAPMAWPLLKPAPPVPAGVRGYYQPGKINVVEFADFECPFCRRLHHQLKEQLAPFGDRVHFVRLNMPLASHPYARGAALAVVCAEPSGHADALAEFLFTTEKLDPALIRAEAGRLGVDLAKYDRCLGARSTEQRLEREREIVEEAGLEGLPTTYIGSRRIVGAQPPEVFQDALEHASENTGDRGVPAWAYLLLVAAIAVAIVQTGRSGSADKPELAKAS